MSNKLNEEIENLEKQLELLKQKQQLEEDNKQLKEDIAYLRKSKEKMDKVEEITGLGVIGCFGISVIGFILVFLILIFGSVFS